MVENLENLGFSSDEEESLVKEAEIQDAEARVDELRKIKSQILRHLDSLEDGPFKKAAEKKLQETEDELFALFEKINR